jgi:hypothetical protein
MTPTPKPAPQKLAPIPPAPPSAPAGMTGVRTHAWGGVPVASPIIEGPPAAEDAPADDPTPMVAMTPARAGKARKSV